MSAKSTASAITILFFAFWLSFSSSVFQTPSQMAAQFVSTVEPTVSPTPLIEPTAIPTPTVEPTVLPVPTPTVPIPEPTVTSTLCPESVKVSTLNSKVQPGETITFTADIKSVGSSLTYGWELSAGTIVEGQGTPVIIVQTDFNSQGQVVTATLVLGGIAENCSNKRTSESKQIELLPVLLSVDDFVPKSLTREKRFELLAFQLQNDPTAETAVVAYRKAGETNLQVEERLLKDKQVLVNFYRINPQRINLINAGQTGGLKTSEIFVVPAGATLREIPTTDLTTLTGRVRSADGANLSGVRVKAVKIGNSKTFDATTEEDGIYTTTIEIGLYKITVSKDGFKSVTKTSPNIQAQQTGVVEFTLQKNP